ncbi:hypothetical protein PUW24_00475 (plasmid) [Paenibacillus urinalis]|uniref:Uncharacterized protein n=1 Tax=Paenibacillus urinalis TaxID=521520 RepID=A0AAX3N6I0_9BACL|nr:MULTISPECIES: hypothetical protein [Paenibacillus]MCM3131103.1 hypothetical protein [Paenibacillus sp. MER 78]WDH85325.1 hypothetical protein PUW23_26175 [Paenibacillus urinalis]WDH95247.1 hypothetical protein PUW24_00475 [Paenibacillus urinalis]WDI05288.1 hypothetical protein PUW25_27090 [Paenibacillus urinalis]
MNKTLFIFIVIVFILCACGSKSGTQEQFAGVTLNGVLTVLNEAGIQYVERIESQNVYDSQREGAEIHLYQLEQGNLTIYLFADVAQRREVQRDPFPTASAAPPNGSYGMGRILVYYYDGNTTMAHKLREAFEPLGVEEKNQLE